jgi:hypothetical protein
LYLIFEKKPKNIDIRTGQPITEELKEKGHKVQEALNFNLLNAWNGYYYYGAFHSQKKN